MNVLITGGLGVNGAATARLLVQRGQRPVLLDNRMDTTLVDDIRDEVDIVIGDITDPAAVEDVVASHSITHIAHLAALMPGPSEADPRLAGRVGVDGLLNVLETARTNGIERVVFTSSKAVYGEITGVNAPPTLEPMNEDHPKRPIDLYGSIKVACEELGRYYRERRGVQFVALRFASIYGPGKESRHGPLSFYGQLIERARSGEHWDIAEGGDQRNEAMYVGDVARAIHAALTAQALKAWTYNIGTGRTSTPSEFLAAAEKLFPKHNIQLGRGSGSLGRTTQTYSLFDIGAARRELGYEPAFDVERGVRDYVATLDRLRG